MSQQEEVKKKSRLEMKGTKDFKLKWHFLEALISQAWQLFKWEIDMIVMSISI